jgi:hypothetical protein
MSRPRKCKVCVGDPAITGQVNGLIEAGVRLKTIAEQVPVFSAFQLSRHKRNCLALKVLADTAAEGSAEIQRWLTRAEQTFLVAQANGDPKSAVAAISTAVRALSSLHKQQEKEREAEPADDPNRLTIANLDQLVRQRAAIIEQEHGICLYCRLPKNRKGQNELSTH